MGARSASQRNLATDGLDGMASREGHVDPDARAALLRDLPTLTVESRRDHGLLPARELEALLRVRHEMCRLRGGMDRRLHDDRARRGPVLEPHPSRTRTG